MAKGEQKSKIVLDRVLLIISVVLLISVLSAALYSIFFIGSHLIDALSPSKNGEEEIKFDLDGYRALNLKGDANLSTTTPESSTQ